MTRLKKDEIAKLKECFAQWKTPLAMRASAEAEMDSTGDKTLFSQAGLEFIREAKLAGDFGVVRKAEKIRLVSASRPDFTLCINGKVECFEAVEVDDPGRRRGDEYKTAGVAAGNGGVEDWKRNAEQVHYWLRRACEKKKQNRYGKDTHLIIYLNPSDYGVYHNEIKGCFASATEIVKDDFASVWVFWKLEAYLVWHPCR